MRLTLLAVDLSLGSTAPLPMVYDTPSSSADSRAGAVRDPGLLRQSVLAGFGFRFLQHVLAHSGAARPPHTVLVVVMESGSCRSSSRRSRPHSAGLPVLRTVSPSVILELRRATTSHYMSGRRITALAAQRLQRYTRVTTSTT